MGDGLARVAGVDHVAAGDSQRNAVPMPHAVCQRHAPVCARKGRLKRSLSIRSVGRDRMVARGLRGQDSGRSSGRRLGM